MTMRQEQDTAKNITAILDRGISSLKKETVDQLVAARNKAVAAMPMPAAETEPMLAGVGRFFVFHLHGQRLWLSMAGLLGAGLVVFVLLQSVQNREPAKEAVGIDALLLGSDLPPEAYLDKGFDAWLEQSSRH